jgi:hypothetical protein
MSSLSPSSVFSGRGEKAQAADRAGSSVFAIASIAGGQVVGIIPPATNVNGLVVRHWVQSAFSDTQYTRLYTGPTAPPAFQSLGSALCIAQVMGSTKGQRDAILDIYLPPGYGLWMVPDATGATGNHYIDFDLL